MALLLRPPAGQPRWAVDRALLWPVAALYLWALVTLLWTVAPAGGALKLWANSLGVGLIALFSYGAALTATPEERRLVSRALSIGFALGFALYASEYFTDAAIHRWRYSSDNVSVARAFAQASAPLVLLSVSSLAIAGMLKGPARFLPAIGVLLLSIVFRHIAGVLGLAVAAIAWAIAVWWPVLARRLWTFMLLLTLLVVPFQGLVLDQLDDGWKSKEILVREQIWRVGAERLLEKPVFGWGFDASGDLPNTGEVSLRKGKDAVITNHPHNVSLELWLELGIPGVLLGGWFLFALKRRVQTPAAQAILLYLLIQGIVSASLWPSRWLSMACVAALLWPLVSPRADKEPRPG